MKKHTIGLLIGLLAAAGALFPASRAAANARTIALESVPIDRLIANLEREFQTTKVRPGTATPDGPQSSDVVAWRIGRLYAFSYAQKLDSVKVSVKTKNEVFGGGTEFPPRAIRTTEDEELEQKAEEQLRTAVDWYTQSLKLNTDAPYVWLGYGWVLEESGRPKDAMDAYRRVVDLELAHPDKKQYTPQEKRAAGEALDSLIDLLDPVRDADELKLRERQRQKVATWRAPISPVVIPLSPEADLGNLVRDDLAVNFDVDGSGLGTSWTWIDPSAAWLVWDADDSGRVDSGRRLFGNVTFWLFWDTGFDAMAALDDNADGALEGSELKGLKTWCDANCDGVADAGELHTLDDLGIVSLSFEHESIECAGRTMWVSRAGTRFADGSTRPLYDVILMPRPGETVVVRTR